MPLIYLHPMNTEFPERSIQFPPIFLVESSDKVCHKITRSQFIKVQTIAAQFNIALKSTSFRIHWNIE